MPAGPAWSDANGWNQAPYCSTIQSAYSLQPGDPGYTGENNNPQGLIVARSSAGVETWRYDTTVPAWTQTSDSEFPAFTGDQLTAYNALTHFWKIATGGVRDHYNDETNVIGNWLSDLQNGRVSRPSGVSAADWQAVTTQIQNELQNVSYVQNWFGTNVSGLIDTIYLGKDMTVQTVGNYLSLSGGSSASTVFSIASLFFNGAWAVLGFPGLEAGDASAIAGILATAFSAAATAPGGSSYQGTYAGLQTALNNAFNQAVVANGDIQQAITGGTAAATSARPSVHIPGDYGLLTAIGEMISSTI